MENGKILIVDDEESVRAMLYLILSKEGYDISTAEDGEEALTMAEQFQPDIIMMDIRMPKLDGMSAFKILRQKQNATVILMTAFAEVNSAVEAMKLGAYDYVIKPFNIDEIKIMLRRAFDAKRLVAEANLLRQKLSSSYRLDGAITNSPKMHTLYETAAKVAPTQATLLITGESGTGKEVMANMVHYCSTRAAGPLIKVNCSALPEALLESELFGHEKGAFTNAIQRRLGRFELANKGTIFLDEIGEMPFSVQVKLLRVLQEREFERVGGTQTLKTDIRIIAATNRSLTDLVAKGQFREDLYYRLAVVTLEVPPLRERAEDISLLARILLQKFVLETGREIDDFDSEALSALEKYHWPGNVRELANVIERAVIMSSGRMIFSEDLPLHIQSKLILPPELKTETWEGRHLRDIIKEAEKNIIENALHRNRSNKMRTAKELGMSRRALLYKIEEYGLSNEMEG